MKEVVLVMVFLLAVVVAALAGSDVQTVLPAKISREAAAGNIFAREDVIRTAHKSGNVTLDVTTLLSSDEKFASGMYQSGRSYFELTEPYGVDEFMYFLNGSVILT